VFFERYVTLSTSRPTKRKQKQADQTLSHKRTHKTVLLSYLKTVLAWGFFLLRLTPIGP
jgi:hypothetical protein